MFDMIGVFPCFLMQSYSLPRHLSPFPPPFEVGPDKQIAECVKYRCWPKVWTLQPRKTWLYSYISVLHLLLLFLVVSEVSFKQWCLASVSSVTPDLVQSKLTLFRISINFSPSTIINLVQSNVTICLFFWTTIQPFIIIEVGLGYDLIL